MELAADLPSGGILIRSKTMMRRKYRSRQLLSLIVACSFNCGAAQSAGSYLPLSPAQSIHNSAADALMQGRYLEALEGFSTVIELEPSNALAYYNRGNAHYFRREFELALKDFDSALKLKPGFAPAAMNRGVVHSNMGLLDEALKDLDLAVTLDPANPDVFFNRAIVHIKRGSMPQALGDYDKIVQLDVPGPDLAAARTRLNALLSRVDEVGVVGKERNKRIIEEMDHARSVEQFMDFADRSCISRGDDPKELSVHAAADGWHGVAPTEMNQASTPDVKVSGGWTVTNRLGSLAVIQSNPLNNPGVHFCLITAKLGDAHWFEDYATLFTQRYQSPRLVVRERANRRTSEQVVVRVDQSRVEVTIDYNADRRVFTVRTVHGALR